MTVEDGAAFVNFRVDEPLGHEKYIIKIDQVSQKHQKVPHVLGVSVPAVIILDDKVDVHEHADIEQGNHEHEERN